MSTTTTSPTAPAPQQIPVEKIKEYVNANVPILPLSTDGKQDVRNLFTIAELDALRSGDTLSEKEKSEVFETEKDFKSGKEIPVVHYLKLLAKQIPLTFWTEEKIKMQQWHGIACLTGLTSIPAPSDKTKVLIIIGIDADDYRTRYILEGLVKQCGLLDKTIVQETAHKGMHVLIAVAVDPKNQEELETWRKRALLPSHCKDCKIEIKTTTMQITLDPSKHRIDKTLSYTRISNVVSICEYRDFYDLLIQRLQLEGCLRCTPEEYHARQEKQEQSDYDKNSSNGMADRRDQDRKEFTETELANGVRIILGVDEDNLRDGSPFGPIYYEGGHVRYLVSMALAGHLFWHNITSGHAKKLIEKLEATCSNQKLGERLKTVTNVYKSGWAEKKIIGRSGLIDAFKRAQKDNKENETLARQRLEKLNLAFGLPDKKPKSKASDLKIGSGKLARLNEADLIVDLARRKIRFMFMNHLKQPLAVIQVRNHCEIMDMRDKDADFAGALRRIWREENIAQNNTLKSTIPEDMLRRAQLGLIADLRSLERAPIETHLRVAWKVKDKVLRYDLTNALWQQVEISAEGVKTIDSKTILDDITQYENSGFAEDKMPIFFQRYASKPQVLPAETFDQNIFDRFINELTNVTDTRAHAIAKQFAHYWKTEGSFDNRTKSLLAKVGIISKLIPDIPRFLETVFGNSGSMKTSYLRFEKRLIDPGVTELNNPNISRRDIQQRYAHNHYIIIDNATQVDKWFSDFICSVISGTGGEDRELFTTQGIVNYSIKCCVSVSGINRIFTEIDAVNRSLNFEFLSIDVDSPNYKPESVVYAQFEEMRPQLLAYMFDTVSKAIKIKQTWPPGKYKLGRMADVQEWGEAISQAMGYKEREFLNAHKELELIQHKHASKADPLIVIYEKLFYDLFETENILSAVDKKKRYVIYDSKVLSDKLNKIAEEEGYKTGKENKLWPKDSQQLAERTREISMNLLNTSNISVDIRKRKDTRNNEFILGYPDAVGSYMQGREFEEKTVTDKVKDYRELVFNQCVTILQERHGVEIELEDLLKQASTRSDEVAKYIDGKFQLQDTRKLQPIFEMLQNHQYIEQTSNKPFRFKWLTSQVEDNHSKAVYLASNTCTQGFNSFDIDGESNPKEPILHLASNTYTQTFNNSTISDSNTPRTPAPAGASPYLVAGTSARVT